MTTTNTPDNNGKKADTSRNFGETLKKWANISNPFRADRREKIGKVLGPTTSATVKGAKRAVAWVKKKQPERDAEMLDNFLLDYDPKDDEAIREDPEFEGLFGETEEGEEGEVEPRERDESRETSKAGLKYFENRYKKSLSIDSGHFYENGTNVIALIALLKEHHHAKKKGHASSLLEQYGFDQDNLIQIMEFVSGVDEERFVKWLDAPKIETLKLIYSRILGLHENTAPKIIDKGIDKLNERIDQLGEWKCFSSPTRKRVGEVSHVAVIGKVIRDLKSVEKEFADSEEIEAKRDEIFRKYKVESYSQNEGMPFDTEVIKASAEKKKRSALEKLSKRKDLQEELYSFGSIERAFRATDEIYGSDYENIFGKKRVEVRRELNSEFPEMELGAFLFELINKPNTKGSLFQFLVEKIGSGDVKVLTAKIKEIYQRLCGLYPKLQGTNPYWVQDLADEIYD